MGRKRRQIYKQKLLAGGDSWEEREQQSELPTTPIIAVSKQMTFIAVTYRNFLKVVQLSQGQPGNSAQILEDIGCIRCLSFDPSGEFFLTGGNFLAVGCRASEKMGRKRRQIYKQKLLAGGDSWEEREQQSELPTTPIIAVSKQMTFIAVTYRNFLKVVQLRLLGSCDRDGKVRVSEISSNPFEGDYEIQSYCLGHTGYVAQLKFITDNILLSTGEDGTLRTWNVTNGQKIDVIQLQNQQINNVSETRPQTSNKSGDSQSFVKVGASNV
eukprot:TRINITY_DN16487_c0_g1_i2.p1 TRINITY_DN16487_c0_g1~~TRINITY_DN16487_c0_g1_i2.p1  ORF type:complete len:301 (-),score=30.04 TRINITY_DN16487_c0_g1_i2:72-878(-)